MKKYIILLAFAVLALAQVSCSEDHLDIPQKSVLDYYGYFDNLSDEDVLNLVAAVYGQLRVIYQPAFTLCPNNMTGDVYVGGSDPADGSELHAMASFNSSSTNGQYLEIWTRMYNLIYRANLIVDNMPGTSAVQTRAIAEAKAARAWAMMHTVLLWGNPPLVTNVLEGDLELPNTPAEESWAWIETNFKEAAAVLPSKSSVNGQAAIGGRFTKEACLGFLGKAQVYQGKYSEAKATLKQVMDSNLYDLEADYATLFRMAGDFSKEYLFELDLDCSSTTDMRRLVTTNFWQNGGWRSDQIRVPDEIFNNGWGYMNPSKAFGEGIIAHDGYDSPRRKATIQTYDEVVSNFTYTAGEPGILPGKALHDNAGYLRYKYCLHWEDVLPDAKTRRQAGALVNIPFLRYADVLLLYAECCAQTGTDAAAGLEALNKVRRRAGLSDAPALDMDNEMYGIKAERRFEMFLEDGNRFYDLVRWGDYGTVINKLAQQYQFGKVHYWLNGLKDGAVIDASKNNVAAWDVTYDPINEAGSYVAGKHELLPYPNSELNNNRNLVQNNGW